MSKPLDPLREIAAREAQHDVRPPSRPFRILRRCERCGVLYPLAAGTCDRCTDWPGAGCGD